MFSLLQLWGPGGEGSGEGSWFGAGVAELLQEFVSSFSLTGLPHFPGCVLSGLRHFPETFPVAPVFPSPRSAV